ncbi:MAG: helix-turn-helix transcriptional regulator [Bacteroidota bacterium]
MEKELKIYSLDQLKDEFIGQEGSVERESYEFELKMELIGEMIKKARLARNMTQAELGELVGVQKAQISKLEGSAQNVTLSTIIKIFQALRANVSLQVELQN